MANDAHGQLEYTSHVGRDILSSAAAFKNEAAVIWEYVVNSLQYVDSGMSPRVQVNVKPRSSVIEIHDNGRGMDVPMLRHFFQQHAENLDRKRGRAGRGKFGTGKSAAFGIANNLLLDTCREGRRNVVEVSRQGLETSDGGSIPLNWKVQDEATQRPNGTTIVISDMVVSKIRTQNIIEYIERHLQAFRGKNPFVAVNDHVCVYREPETAKTYPFKPAVSQAKLLGDVELIVKVSRTPLEPDDQGIAITAGEGNLVAQEDGGVSRKELGSYLFGEIDVPNLEAWDSPIEPYDDSRSLELNTEHPVAAVLVSFIGAKLEEVRKELVAASAEAKKSEQARRLAQTADKIAEALNDDFRGIKERLEEIRAAASKSGAATSLFGSAGEAGDESDAWTEGQAMPGILEETEAKDEDKESNAEGRPDPKVDKRGEPEETGKDSVSPAGGAGKRRKPKGGFSVDYRNLGEDEGRSLYDSGSMTILINLDNPVISKALGGGGVDDIGFRRLSFEVAFSEYSMALGYEMAQQDPDIPADDLLYEVRSTLNRVSRAAAALYVS